MKIFEQVFKFFKLITEDFEAKRTYERRGVIFTLFGKSYAK